MNDTLKDTLHTGTIAGIGVATHQLTNLALTKLNRPLLGWKAGAAALGAGIMGDALAVKLNKHIGTTPTHGLNKMASNKYLEKIAGDAAVGMWRGPYAMEQHVAKQHGVDLPNKGFLDTIKFNTERNRERDKGVALSAVGGGTIGGTAGYYGASGLANLLNKHPAVKLKINPLHKGIVGAAIGAYSGFLAGGFGKQINNTRDMAKELHKKYENK